MKIGDHYYIDPETMLKPLVNNLMDVTIEGEQHKARIVEVHSDGTCKVKVVPPTTKE